MSRCERTSASGAHFFSHAAQHSLRNRDSLDESQILVMIVSPQPSPQTLRQVHDWLKPRCWELTEHAERANTLYNEVAWSFLTRQPPNPAMSLLDWAQHLMEEACARHGVVPAPILRALQQQLMPQLLRKCRNHQEAEEQLQEILKIFIEKYRSGTIHGGLLQYARGISRYRNMQRHRKRQQQKEIHRALEARKRPHAPVMEQELDTRIALRQITDLVEKNPAWEALISICVGELTAADLEQETGILSGTLRSKVSRMRKTLRRELTSALGGLMTLWGLLHRRPAHAAGLFAAGAGALAVLIASSGGSAQAPPLQHRVLTAAASPDLFPATLTVPSISVSRPAPSARPVSVVAPVRQVAPDAQPAAPALVAITAEPEPTATSAGGDQLLDAIEAVQIARSHLSDAPEIALELVGP
ncbi:MAG: DNA-directed RNA polymerase specialized sigma24 family protein, partial [Myxococcota bacterium]